MMKFKEIVDRITKNVIENDVENNEKLTKIYSEAGISVVDLTECRHYKRGTAHFCREKLRGIIPGECWECSVGKWDRVKLLKFYELEKGKLYKRVFADERLDFVRIRVDESGFLEVRYKDRENWDFEPMKASKQLNDMRFVEVKNNEI